MATSAFSLLAGADPTVAARLGLAMLALQAAIGATNDLVDAPLDAGRKPGKPIPAGTVSRREAVAVAILAAALGIAMTAPSGPPAVVLAVVILGVGLAYDVWLKGTPLSWLPFAVGIPLLPVYAWLGATGALPGHFAVFLPTAFLAGAALAIANALADVERDRAGGARTVAVHLGSVRAWRLHTGLQAVVVLVALGSLVALARPVAIAAAIPFAFAIGMVAGGAWLARNPDPARRERGWELEALGTALLGGAWLVAVRPG